MQFSRDLRAKVLSGDITVTFRLWRTPKAKVGGRYEVGPGQIEGDSIELMRFGALDETDLSLSATSTSHPCAAAPRMLVRSGRTR